VLTSMLWFGRKRSPIGIVGHALYVTLPLPPLLPHWVRTGGGRTLPPHHTGPSSALWNPFGRRVARKTPGQGRREVPCHTTTWLPRTKPERHITIPAVPLCRWISTCDPTTPAQPPLLLPSLLAAGKFTLLAEAAHFACLPSPTFPLCSSWPSAVRCEHGSSHSAWHLPSSRSRYPGRVPY